jgi:hypothetical protein
MGQIHESNKHKTMFSHNLNSNTCRQIHTNTHGVTQTWTLIEINTKGMNRYSQRHK